MIRKILCIAGFGLAACALIAFAIHFAGRTTNPVATEKLSARVEAIAARLEQQPKDRPMEERETETQMSADELTVLQTESKAIEGELARLQKSQDADARAANVSFLIGWACALAGSGCFFACLWFPRRLASSDV
ncbi:hypothetical protein [Lignipirellula cremea]|uniref:Uncharacterized protein n=1 Tax=Lignipirellula cremea TaxID=2528010 RepID=A0A518DP65_9BACT|nr:hypothetical protein [Lignipirellula cremea]QDU93631.1 hypothetical protein Pla8534_14110 [Lignipirellula cremea]